MNWIFIILGFAVLPSFLQRYISDIKKMYKQEKKRTLKSQKFE
jgi:hypothetical protein